jgi:uncharacterized membrane protein YgdD (TMEM256/DUF423 family)
MFRARIDQVAKGATLTEQYSVQKKTLSDNIVELQRFRDAALLFSMVRSSASISITFNVNLFLLGSTFFNGKLTVETGVGVAPLPNVNS